MGHNRQVVGMTVMALGEAFLNYCYAECINQTDRTLKTRINEHSKPIKNHPKSSKRAEHTLIAN